MVQMQIVRGKHDPRTGAPRNAAVVYDGDRMIDHGEEQEMRHRYPHAIERKLDVWARLSDVERIRMEGPPRGNPLQMPL